MVRAGSDERFELLAHLLGCAVDTRRIGPLRAAINDGEPAVHLGARNVGALVHGEKHALRDGKRRWIAAELFELGTERLDGFAEGLRGRAARAYPAITKGRRTAHRIGMIAAE